MKDTLTIPNILTFIRIALVPVFVVLFLIGKIYFALAIFVIAWATDLLDGYIARKFNQITNLGKVLDPFADKLLKLSALICFVWEDIIPLWSLIVFLVLDIYLVVGATYLLKHENIVCKSNLVGKAGTLVLSVALVMCFFYQYLNNWHLYVLYLGLGIVIFAIISYTIIYYKEFSEKRNQKLNKK